jgi:hypothetical protein
MQRRFILLLCHNWKNENKLWVVWGSGTTTNFFFQKKRKKVNIKKKSIKI